MKKTWRDYILVLIQALLFGAFFIPVELGIALPFSPPGFLHQILLATGIIILVLSFLHLRTNLTPWPTPKKGSYLVTSGVFNLVRHPIYSGLFLTFAGLAFRAESIYRLIITALILLVFYIKTQYEEKQLHKTFPQYAKYKARTGRFIPKLGRALKKGL